MITGPRRPIVEPADLARFLVAFGLVPLLLASEGTGLGDPAWSFALTPTWSIEQQVFSALAGGVLGAFPGRPAHGLAGVSLGVLAGLAADLWLLAGWVKPYEQAFVSMLPQAEWRSDLTGSALALLGVVAAGFVIGPTVTRLIRERSGPRLRPPTGSEVVAVSLAVIGASLLALGIASAAASSALVVPDGAQVQAVTVSVGTITPDPAVLRPGPTRFRCHFEPGAARGYAILVAIPEGSDVETVSPANDKFEPSCNGLPGDVTWGTPVDLPTGRYLWLQIDNSTEVPRTIARSPVVVVAPE